MLYTKFWRCVAKRVFVLSVFFAATLIPFNGEVFADPDDGTTRASDPTAQAHLTINTAEAIEVAVTPGAFNSASSTVVIRTNNFTGYTMAFSTVNENTRLVYSQDNSIFIPTITLPSGRESILSSEFSGTEYGYSLNGTDFKPVINAVVKNGGQGTDSFDLTIGVSTEADTLAGDYGQTLTVAAVANAPIVSIAYAKNTTDTVSNMPAQDEFYLNDDVVTISNKTPIRSGYDFIGWEDSVTNEVLMPSGTYTADPTIANVRTLTAVWELQCTGICYDGNGDDGTGSMAAQNVAAGDTATLRAPNFRKPGYGFLGWNTKADGTGILYGPNETISVTQPVRLWLYATWIAPEQGVTLQTFNKEVEPYSSYEKGTVIALRDERDGNVYAVAKLADENWWITENLRLNPSDANTTITTTNSNNPSSSFIQELETTYKGQDVDPWKTCSVSDANCYNQISYSADFINMGNQSSPNSMQLNTAWYSYGVLYNWYTANGGGSGDICPAGWHLPTGGNGEFRNLDLALGGNGESRGGANVSANWRKVPYNFTYAGYIDGTSSWTTGSNGNYWSSTPGYRLVMYNDNLRPGTDWWYMGRGHSVRCIANSSATHTLSYDANQGTNAPASQSGSSVLGRYTFTISSSTPTRNGYNFVGWATSASATAAEYQPGAEITVRGSTTLYAVWNSIVYMQNWSGCDGLNIGDTVTLRDSRDDTDYTVTKLADGKCWTTNNLRFNFATHGDQITAENTNNPTAEFITIASTKPASSNDWCTSTSWDCSNAFYYNSDNLGDNTVGVDGHTYDEYGVYYNFYAATAGNGNTDTTFNNTAGDICPAGWRIPTGNMDGDFAELDIALGGTGDSSSTIQSRYLEEPNNFYYSGYYFGTGISNRGNMWGSGYWSSSAHYDYAAYHLYIYNGYTNAGTSSYGNIGIRHFGLAVRCLTATPPDRPYNIVYDINGGDAGTMAAHEDVILGDEIMLHASNFSREDYGFAGWNTEPDGTGTNYGPNQIITAPAYPTGGTLTLYANWVASAGTFENFSCDNLNAGSITALTDTDDQTYAVARLADGNCWMIENLRFETSNSVNDNVTNRGTNTAVDDNIFSYGNYYPEEDMLDICPAGWYLPTGEEGGDFRKLGFAISGNNSDFQSGKEAVNYWLSYPNNFTLPGIYMNGVQYRGGAGVYPGFDVAGMSSSTDYATIITTDAIGAYQVGIGADTTISPMLVSARCVIGATRNITLSFDANGGEDAPAAQTKSTIYPSDYFDIADDEPTYEHHYFYAWAKDPSLDPDDPDFNEQSEEIYYPGDEIIIATDTTLYAIWNRECPGVCYSGNGDDGTGTMDMQLARPNASVTLTAPNYSKPGYGFAGWNTAADGSGTNYGPNQTITMPAGGQVWLYAKWVAAEQGVTLQTFDKTTEPYASAAVDTIIALEDERDGNVYAVAKLANNEWWMIENLRLNPNDRNTYITEYNTNHPTTELVETIYNRLDSYEYSSITMAACADSNYDCENQLSFGTGNIDRNNPASPTEGSQNASWYSYGVVYNWYTATGGHGTHSTPGDVTEGDICPAGWHLPTGSNNGEYAAMDDARGGSGTGGDSTAAADVWFSYPVNLVLNGSYSNTSASSRGYSARLWTSSARELGSNHELGLAVIGYSNRMTIGRSGTVNKWYAYAVRCAANPTVEYTLNYDLNGASGNIASQTTSSTTGWGEFEVTSTTPTREGYNFVGWSTNASDEYGDYWEGYQFITTDTTSTLYAIWQERGIFYHGNDDDGTGAMVKQSAEPNTEVTLEASNFSRPEYGFAGWNTSADGGGANYGPNQTIIMPNSGRLDLFAYWVSSTGDLQSFNCDTLSAGDVTALTDTRDGQTYAVSKLSDGKCWMIENLRLDLSDTNVTITSANTNNPTADFISAANNHPASTISWCSTHDSACDDQIAYSAINMNRGSADARYLYGGYYNWYAATAGNGTYATTSGDTAGDICPAGWHLPTGTGAGEFGKLSSALGGYQDANGVAQSMDSSTTPNATIISNALRATQNNFVYTAAFSGEYTPSYNDPRGPRGYYWTSTVDSNSSAYYTYFNDVTPMVEPGTTTGYKYTGRAVRCVANYQDYILNYDANGGTDAPAAEIGISSGGQHTFTLNNSVPHREGYGFLGWSTNASSTTADYQPGGNFSTANTVDTLYAIWGEPGIFYHGNGDDGAGTMAKQSATPNTEVRLDAPNFSRSGFGNAGWNTKADGTGTLYGPNQTIVMPDSNRLDLYVNWVASAGDFQSFNCNTLAAGAITALTDARDGQTYAVSKLAGGECWMIENLRLDLSDPDITITAENTNNPSAGFITAANSHPASSDNWCSSVDSSCTDQIVYDTNNLDRVDTNSRYSYGVYYNWYTASAGKETNASGNTTGDICPAGWHLPAYGSSSTGFNKLSNALGGYHINGATQWMNATTTPTGAEMSKILRSAPNNFVYSGTLHNESSGGRGGSATYWNNKSYGNGSYTFAFTEAGVNPEGHRQNFYDAVVRCIKK